MDDAFAILQSLVDEQPEPAMGSEYLRARHYLDAVARPRGKRQEDPAHGANESDFGAIRLAE